VLLEPETPLRRCAELDFGFPPHASLVVTCICYPELKLSIRAAGLVAQSLSYKTLPTELGRLGFCRNWSLEHALPVSPWSCKSSKRGFSQQVRAIPGESNRTKPETPLSRSAELDFDSLSSSSRCSTNLLHPIAHHLSCKTLPTELGRLGFCRKCSLERLLLVFSRGCNCSKRGFWLKLVLVGGPETRNPV